MGIFGRLFRRSGEPEVVQRIRLGAEAGDVVAQRGLGALYFEGKLVPQDYGQAARWYALAATQDDARSLFVLGEMHARGLGVVKDLDVAEQLFVRAADHGHAIATTTLASLLDYLGRHDDASLWWERAANAGDARAAYNLGCSYNDGLLGTQRDRTRALAWFKRAAELGHADAQFNLARHLATGDGIDKDEVAAHAWLTLSLGHREDMDTARLREIVESRLAPDQLARAQALAAQLRDSAVSSRA